MSPRVKTYVKGSLLLESAVAMTIIAISLALSFSHASSLMKHDQEGIKLKARQAFEVIQLNDDADDYYEYEGFRITKTSKPYENNHQLMKITLSAIDVNDDVIIETTYLKRI